jgi:hypothetical protein
MILTIAAAAALAAHLGTAIPSQSDLLSPVQYCGQGYDLDIRGRCYPNGVIPPQYQSARQGRAYRGGRYPVPCGNGADLDSRDGQCYPTGTVPPRFQSGRQEYYYDRPRRGYY